jgi:hypothetical protein
VAVTGLLVAIQLDCAGCQLNFSATSSGEIAGFDGTTAYDATWTSLTMTATGGSYASTCVGPAWRGAAIAPSPATIQGVQLRYGSATYASATVTLTFGGDIVAGVFAPATKQIDISAGPVAISVINQGIRGGLPIVPPVPTVPCGPVIQTFTADGTFLTLGAAAP